MEIYNLKFMSRFKDIYVILFFALAHCLVALASKVFGFYDELILTLLTMMMSVVLSLRKRMNVLFMVLSIIGVNILGFYFGRWIGDLIKQIVGPSITGYVSPFCTFITTVLLGLLQLLITRILRGRKNFVEADTKGIMWMLLAIMTVLIVRLFRMLIDSYDLFEQNIILNVCLDFTVCILAIVYMAYYAIKANDKMIVEQEKTRKAQFNYLKLKQQVAPHFLFNTLNSLDGLICVQKYDQASEFVHKLASIYRYMIDNGDEALVYLEEELSFVEKYVDLLKVRFPEDLAVNINVPEKYFSSSVVPCSVQMLVENATKHNAIAANEPLVIDITVEDGYIKVVNNLNPKVSSQPSTGRGLKYVSQQYEDIAYKKIIIQKTSSQYIVELPIL